MVRGGRRYVYAQLPPRLTSQERFEDFERCATLFRFVFDKTRAYHTGSMADFNAKTQKMMREAQPQPVRTRGQK